MDCPGKSSSQQINQKEPGLFMFISAFHLPVPFPSSWVRREKEKESTRWREQQIK
jgi:hypothetical protein